MENRIKDTALLVFSLSAKKEADRKALFGSGKRATTHDFFKALIKQTADVALNSGVDVVWVDEKKQRGDSFGERYANAFQELFDRGYENVVSIGNDCPELTADILKTAVRQLQQQKIVLGPSTDGGAYLIGIQRRFFNAEAFCTLPWLQETLSDELISLAFQHNERVFLLQQLSDIDTQKDVLTFALDHPHLTLSKFILEHLYKASHVSFKDSVPLRTSFFIGAYSLRGPPRH